MGTFGPYLLLLLKKIPFLHHRINNQEEWSAERSGMYFVSALPPYKLNILLETFVQKMSLIAVEIKLLMVA